MTSDYKKYSLGKLQEWVHDSLSTSEATPQEIYDVIKNVVSENYYIFKNQTERCYELLALLNGNGKGHIEAYDKLVCDKDDPSPECKKSWNDFWEENYYPEEYKSSKEDKVKKWVLPVEQSIIDGVDDYYVTFPDDLLKAANLKDGDQIEWIDQGDGSYILKKVKKEMSYDEAIAAGWEMTADGFWFKK